MKVLKVIVSLWAFMFGAQANAAASLAVLNQPLIPTPTGMSLLNYKIPMWKTGSAYATSVNARTFINPAAFNGPTYFVNPSTGSDTGACSGLVPTGNGGTAPNCPFQSLKKAASTGNTSSPNGYVISAASGLYYRANGFNPSAGAVWPAAHVALIPTVPGTRITLTTADSLTWTLLSGTTYQATTSSAVRVFETDVPNTYGDYTELTAQTSQANVQANLGTWYDNGTTLFVNRTDGAAVTASNTRAYRAFHNIQLQANNFDFYMENVDLEGGDTSAFDAKSYTATRSIGIKSSTARYSGSSTALTNGFSTDLLTGIVVYDRVTASSNVADGINTHNTTGASLMVCVNCLAYDEGRYTSTSNNGITGHETTLTLDISGEYHHCYGRTVGFIGSSRYWGLGVYSHDSFGDISLGGGFTPGEFWTSSTLPMWLEQPKASTTGCAFCSDSNLITEKNQNILSGIITGTILPY